MQFFKSIVVSILAFSAYAVAVTLPEVKIGCQLLNEECSSLPDADLLCCFDLPCSNESNGLGTVSLDSKFRNARTHISSGN
jgi:hypothetical protein